jgi:hypothetical protein
MKLGENVYGHNISAKFNKQPNRFNHFRVMALYLFKMANASMGVFCGALALLFM